MAPVGQSGRELAKRVGTDSGIGTTIDLLQVSTAERLAVTCLLAVAMYNAIEMVAIIFLTFRRRQGLYFWSLLIASVGCGWFALGFVVNDFQLAGKHHIVPALMTCTGWMPMVTGQSLVLYSRLHLMSYNARELRLVRIMIIFNAITQHLPSMVLVIGSNSSDSGLFLVAYSIDERIQVSVFFLQELILSVLYLNKSFVFLRQTRRSARRGGLLADTQRQAKGMVIHLILVNVLVVALDVTILYLEFAGLYFIQTSYKAFVYSVKLKCEASILNNLVDFMKAARVERDHLPTIMTKAGAAQAVQSDAYKVADWSSHMTRNLGGTWGSSMARCEHGVQVGEDLESGVLAAGAGTHGTEEPMRGNNGLEDPNSIITITQTVKVQHSSRETSGSAPNSVAGDASRHTVAGPSNGLSPAPSWGRQVLREVYDVSGRLTASVV